MKNILLYFALKYQGNWEKIYLALDAKEHIVQLDLLTIEDQLAENCDYITFVDRDNIIKTIFKSLKDRPPFVIFMSGKRWLLTNEEQVWYVNDFTSDGSLIEHFSNQNWKPKNVIIATGYPLKHYLHHHQSILNKIKELGGNYLVISEIYDAKISDCDFNSRLYDGLTQKDDN